MNKKTYFLIFWFCISLVLIWKLVLQRSKKIILPWFKFFPFSLPSFLQGQCPSPSLLAPLWSSGHGSTKIQLGFCVHDDKGMSIDNLSPYYIIYGQEYFWRQECLNLKRSQSHFLRWHQLLNPFPAPLPPRWLELLKHSL